VTAGRGGRGSATTPLERRYRRWLLAYPAEYRHERGDELLGTLLDLAEPGRTRPRPTEVVALLSAGSARRVAEAWGPAGRSRSATVLSASLALCGAGYVLWMSVRGPVACRAIIVPGGSAQATCPAGSPLDDVLILNPLGYAWLVAAVLLAALPLIGGGRRLALLASIFLTALCLVSLPGLGLPLVPSVVASWFGAATFRTAADGEPARGSGAPAAR
jgi:hypothetical protein